MAAIDAIFKIVKKLRGGVLNYISLESQLSYTGDISQVLIDRLTVVTKGRSGTFSTPYGVADYYIDVYVANTGVVVEGINITLSSDYYAYTDIDSDFQVSFFVFNERSPG